MKKFVALLLSVVIVSSLTGCGGSVTKSEDLPKNIEVQVPAKAGGGTDVMARTLGNQVTKDSGSTFTIVNNADGAGVPAMEKVRNAKPDGSEILQFHSTMLIKTATGVYDKSAADDFTIIGVSQGVDKGAYVLVVSAESEFKTPDDLINKAKAAPGTLLFGVETGGTAHVLTGMFAKTTDVDIKYVEAGTDTEKLTALVGKNIDACFVNPNQAKQYIEAGKVVALACVSTDEEGGRSSVIPDVPSFVESGIELTFSPIFLFLGPKGMDEKLVKKIYDYYVAASKNADVNEVLSPAGFEMEFLGYDEGIVKVKEMQQIITEVTKELGINKK